MSKFTGAYARPVQGVSQQPAEARKDGQCSEQINMVPSIIDGLTDRMGTYKIATLLATLPEDTLIYYYDRGSEEYFIFIRPNADPIIFNETGLECNTTIVATPTTYWKVANPRRDLKLITIADYTFIVNTTVGVEMTSAVTDSKVYESLIYCQFANYGRTYEITLNGTVVASYTTPDGSTASDIDKTATNNVILELANDLAAYSATYNVTNLGNSLHIERVDSSYFTAASSDESNGEDLICLTDFVTDTSKLPKIATQDFVVEVKGESKDSPSFWLKADIGSNGLSTWKETIAPSLKYEFDAATMPHTLIRTGITVGVPQFSIEQGDWVDRAIGDDFTNPAPAFIDETTPITLDTIGTFHGRLWVTSAGSIIFGRTGEFFNFWKESTQTESATDPFDLYADTDQVENLIFGQMHEGDLVLFSENSQFIIKGDKDLKKSTATIQRVTDFESIPVSPHSAGNALFFAFDYGGYTGIREFFTDTITEVKEARIITEHVPKYIKGSATYLAASTNQDWLIVLSDSEPNVFYIYNWLWISNEKVQSAWHKWKFPEGDKILFVQFSQEYLYFITERSTGINLERITLSDPNTSGISFPVKLDQLQEITATKTGNEYQMADMYPDESLDDLIFVRGEGAYESEIGTAIRVTRDGGYIYTTEDLGDASISVFVGTRFLAEYKPTEPVIRDHKDRAIRSDKLTVAEVLIIFEDTGGFDSRVTYENGTEMCYPYDGRILGSAANVIGFATLSDGEISIPIMMLSTMYELCITKDIHTPVKFQNLEWAGQFTQRGRRV